jgi:hypothetical protein
VNNETLQRMANEISEEVWMDNGNLEGERWEEMLSDESRTHLFHSASTPPAYAPITEPISVSRP